MTRLFDLDVQLLFDVGLMGLSVFVLFLLLSKKLFAPARRLMAERQTGIAGRLENSRREWEEAHSQRQAYEEKLADIHRESEQILGEARERALADAAHIQREAKEEAVRILKRTDHEAELARERMLEEGKQEMIAVAALMAAKAAAIQINKELQEKLIEEALRELRE